MSDAETLANDALDLISGEVDVTVQEEAKFALLERLAAELNIPLLHTA